MTWLAVQRRHHLPRLSVHIAVFDSEISSFAHFSLYPATFKDFLQRTRLKILRMRTKTPALGSRDTPRLHGYLLYQR